MHTTLRKAAILTATILTAGSCFASNLMMGTKEARLNGVIDFDTASGAHFAADAMFGYFYSDNFEAGPEINMAFNDDSSFFAAGYFAANHWPLDYSYLIPFAGLGLGFAYADYDMADSETAILFYLEGGAKLFIDQAMNVAFTMSTRLSLATGKIYASEGEADSYDLAVLFGLSTYWD